ncbi:hypothetical protein WOLCODRAFT_90148 [Wolfiporia cocos MD-104 SS10]|uniref:RING-CH-type domain-containing protein n=1 Tax=Wolfiporia cocos (strain MD-104) TaxID=742152 RepID=A0A2H3JT07_WOLCO|nr:hypothetical protein WOLCODRAFT_90148 [Wolfiporia cocos MD-104 SS10]
MNSDTYVPTVDDLRVKLCFICREEERYDAPEDPPRAWTHPCSCTLVAHESCLLQWIKSAQQDPSRARNALKCPQCGAAYELESDNPFILRLLDNVNTSLSIVGKLVSAAGLAGVVVSVGFGVYVICTSYGAYAVQEFLGKEMYNMLLTDDPSNWPWHAYINLPLVPISLVLSRTRFFDTLPLVPLFLAWPSSPPVSRPSRPSLASLNPPQPAPILAWPPSPLLVTLAFPFLTAVYRRLRARVKHWLMGTAPVPRQAVREVVWEIGDEPAIQARIGLAVDPVRQRRPAQGPQAHARDAQDPNADAAREQANAQGQAPAEAAPDEPARVAERTLRVTNASLGRFVGGALMLPAIANYMGAALLRLSRHSEILRRVLAVRASRARLVVGGWADALPGAEGGYLRQLGMGLRVALNLVAGGTRTWHECDPVWWRNSIGLGIFVVVRDCIKLLHLYLAKRELETRRVKDRPFVGVDAKELDLIYPRRAHVDV